MSNPNKFNDKQILVAQKLLHTLEGDQTTIYKPKEKNKTEILATDILDASTTAGAATGVELMKTGIVLMQAEGLTLEQIARIWQVSVRTVRNLNQKVTESFFRPQGPAVRVY